MERNQTEHDEQPKKRGGLLGKLANAWERGKENQQKLETMVAQDAQHERERAAHIHTFLTNAAEISEAFSLPDPADQPLAVKKYLLSEDDLRAWTVAKLENSPHAFTASRTGREQKFIVVRTPEQMNGGVEGAHYFVITQAHYPSGEWAPVAPFQFTQSTMRDVTAPEKVLDMQDMGGKTWVRERYNALTNADKVGSFSRFERTNGELIAAVMELDAVAE